jgi:beta-glucosidase
VPTVLVLHLERPAVIPELAEAYAAVVGVLGRTPPEGRLPFERPSSMEAVRAQLPDVPFDSLRPLFPHGHGLSY